MLVGDEDAQMASMPGRQAPSSPCPKRQADAQEVAAPRQRPRFSLTAIEGDALSRSFGWHFFFYLRHQVGALKQPSDDYRQRDHQGGVYANTG